MGWIDIINAALTRTGSEPIASLSDPGSGAQIAAQNYDAIKRAALRSYPWRWASKVQALNLLDAGAPPEPWLFAYQLPTDMLLLRSVKVNGMPIPYDTMLDKLFCDADGSGVVLAAYTWQVPETNWDPLFIEAITQRLEALFLRGVREMHSEGAARDRDADRAFRLAQLRDAQRSPPIDPRNSLLQKARRG